MKPVLTDAQVDALLDSVLRASGSALSNYTFKKTLDAMREAVREIERAACQHRGEPVKLDRYDAGLLGGQDGMPAYVWHDIIRAELDRAYDFYMDQIDRAAPQPVTPAQEPSDDDLHNLWSRSGGVMRTFARALLARYGNAAQPAASTEPVATDAMHAHFEGIYNGLDLAERTEIIEGILKLAAPVAAQPSVPDGWKLVPVEPDYIMKAAARNAPIPAVLLDSISARADLENTTRYKSMLAAAPKFGEEE